MKSFLLFICLIGLSQAFPQDLSSEEFPDIDLDDDDFDEEVAARGFWGDLFKQSFNVVKKGFKLEELSCNGPACSACITAKIPKVLDKKGCFNVAYNRKTGILRLDLNLGEKEVWGTDIKAGAAPACTRLPVPISKVCVQDFVANFKTNGDGNLCFTINFNTYGVGAKYCINMEEFDLKPDKLPTIVQT